MPLRIFTSQRIVVHSTAQSIKPNTGTCRDIFEDLQEGFVDLHPLSDTMPVRHDFDAPFEIKIHDQDA
jgi:hypothetical protein